MIKSCSSKIAIIRFCNISQQLQWDVTKPLTNAQARKSSTNACINLSYVWWDISESSCVASKCIAPPLRNVCKDPLLVQCRQPPLFRSSSPLQGANSGLEARGHPPPEASRSARILGTHLLVTLLQFAPFLHHLGHLQAGAVINYNNHWKSGTATTITELSVAEY